MPPSIVQSIMPRTLVAPVLVLVAALTAVAGGARPALAQQREEPPEANLTYTGRVLGPDGKPVAGAVVLADNGGSYQVMKTWDETPWRNWVADPIGTSSIGPFTVRAKTPTDADGRFRVEGVRPPAGSGWVVVVHPDFAAARKAAAADAKDGVLDVGDVRLAVGAAVRATVRTPDGEPAPGAWVVVRPSAPSSPDRGPSSWAHGEEPGDVRVGRTGDDGTCVVRGLTPGRFRVAAFTERTLPSVVEAEGGAGEVAAAEVRLVPGASLRVEVAWRGTGKPVAGARVTVDRPEAGQSWPGPAPLAKVRSDATGVAAIEGIDALEEFRVTVVPPDFADDTVHSPGVFHVVATAKRGDTVRVELTPPRTLVVRVLDAYTKVPLEGARVLLWPDWDRFDHSGGQASDLVLAWDAAAKAYATPHARPGPWTLYVWAPGHRPGGLTNVRVAAEGDASPEVVELGPAGAFAKGRVVEKSTGRPVDGATVASYEWVQRFGDGQRASAATGADGRFQLSPLIGEGFPLRVEVRAPGYVPAFPEWAADGRSPDLGDVALVRAATIRGRVTDAEGRPRARVAVHLDARGFEGHGKGDGWDATTDDDGRFEFPGLLPGEYTIRDHRDPPIRVAEGATAERDVVR
jgi:protocatechuate 3,4-dioxygenase beta subunit